MSAQDRERAEEVVAHLGRQILALGLVPVVAERLGRSESLVAKWCNPRAVNALPARALAVIVEEIRRSGGVDPVSSWIRRAAEAGEDAREQEPLRFPPHSVERGRAAR